MNGQPDISFVVGSYNRRRFLEATIESIRQEANGFAWEIIVVDGGSDDGSLEYLTTQKDVILIVQHNRGMWRGAPLRRRSWGYFINLGFKAAQGRLVCMLSDDCLLVPGSIQAAVATYDCACASGRKVGAVAFYFRDWPHERNYKIHRSYGRRLVVNHGIYVNEALRNVGFADEESYGFYCADGDLSLRIWDAGYEIVDCRSAIVEHHAHAPERSSHSNNEQYRRDLAVSRKRWEHLLAESGGFESDWPELVFADASNTARNFPASGAVAQMRWKALRNLKNVVRRIVKRFRGRK